MGMEKQKPKQGPPDFIVAVRIIRSRSPAVKDARAHPKDE
jgi:hypothetical protein